MTKGGKEMDEILTGYSDFIMGSLDFMKKNLDKILMMTLIIFLLMAWTIVFEWKVPKKKT